jgi:hypothetical protein
MTSKNVTVCDLGNDDLVKSAEIAAVRSRLEEFAAEVFAGLPRSDQRATGELYVRGLLLDG